MSDVAIVGFAQSPDVRRTTGTTNGVEMLVPVFADIYAQTGFTKKDIGFWCSGSSDYLAGRAFSFISAIDAIGAFPPIVESHVEADAAWALYEAWIKIKTGEVDTAVVYGFGKSSAGVLRRTLSMQLDPYSVGPLWPDSISLAAMQARLGLEAGRWSEAAMAEVVAASRAAATTNPNSQLSGLVDIEELLKQPFIADPLRAHDCAPITDGAAAIVLASADRAREIHERPAFITGIAHRVDSSHLGSRDLLDSSSTRGATQSAGGSDGVEIAEIYSPFSHQHLLLKAAIGLSDNVKLNPSGGPLAGNPMFSGGLVRIGQAAKHIFEGNAQKVLAHSTSGPLLQHNLVCVMEGSNA